MRGSDRRNIGEALLGQRHAGRDMARLSNIDIEGEYRLRAALFGPADDPAERGLAEFGAEQSGLGPDDRIANPGHGEDIAHQILATLRNRQRAAAQAVDEIDLLDRIDAQLAGQPELIDAAADFAVA